MSGWLHNKVKSKSWKRKWFVLKEQVLYMYKASEDVMALDSKPVLGYVVETFKEVKNRIFKLYVALRGCFGS